ncbi:MAG TPA: hypothetical protein DCO79_08065 [Spirochaeta sp.]|nr:hypothetical protein [Spirochaeta sp.]
MKRIITSLAVGLTIFIFCAVVAAAQTAVLTAEEIVSRADDVMDYSSAYTEARMINTDRFGEKVIAYRAWSKGTNFLMEFDSDAEYGQKILRTDERIYHFFPDSETVFTKSKGDSVVGLISYDDISNESGMLDNYEAELLGEDVLEGTACFKIKLKAKPRRRVAYPVQIVWIVQENFVIRRVEMFTRSNKPLKTMVIDEVKDFGGSLLAAHMLITDEVRRGVTSEIFIDNAELNIDIDDKKFTRRELTR